MPRFTCSAVQETGCISANGTTSQASGPATRFTPAAGELHLFLFDNGYILYFHKALTVFKGGSFIVIVVADAAHCFKDADGAPSCIWLIKQRRLRTQSNHISTREIRLSPKINEKNN